MGHPKAESREVELEEKAEDVVEDATRVSDVESVEF
jgi:hypothetical protein